MKHVNNTYIDVDFLVDLHVYDNIKRFLLHQLYFSTHVSTDVHTYNSELSKLTTKHPPSYSKNLSKLK